MGKPAAKQGDEVVAPDLHLIQPPAPAPPLLVPHPFSGKLDGGLSANVKIEGKAAATISSMASNNPPHAPSGGTFVIPPTNKASIVQGSATVRINKKPAARSGDAAMTCHDAPSPPLGKVIAVGKVFIGG